MTTGNDPYLEHLRGQLTDVLDDVSPPAAPTAAIKRKGNAMRVRRRVGIAAGILVAVVTAVLVPSLLRTSAASGPVGGTPPNVTVDTIGRSAPRGLIAQGAINGKPWRITLIRQQGNQLCVQPSGGFGFGQSCGSPGSYGTNWPTTLDGFGGNRANALYGLVAQQVSMVSVELSDRAVLDLRPVGFEGRRWIGVEIPTSLKVIRLVAYSRGGEIAHAIPFTAGPGGLPSVEDWQRPGQPTPGVVARQIASGVTAGRRWRVTAHLGPWGLCVIPWIGGSGNMGCTTGTDRRPGGLISSGEPGLFTWSVGIAQPQTSYLLLSMTNGSTQRVPVVQVGNLRLYTVVLIHGLRIAHWAAYDSLGHRLYGGQGGAAFK
jgi:hypothetical protein